MELKCGTWFTKNKLTVIGGHLTQVTIKCLGIFAYAFKYGLATPTIGLKFSPNHRLIAYSTQPASFSVTLSGLTSRGHERSKWPNLACPITFEQIELETSVQRQNTSFRTRMIHKSRYDLQRSPFDLRSKKSFFTYVHLFSRRTLKWPLKRQLSTNIDYHRRGQIPKTIHKGQTRAFSGNFDLRSIKCPKVANFAK